MFGLKQKTHYFCKKSSHLNPSKPMKYCSNCGAKLPDDVKFCFSCGTATANSVDNSAVSAPASGAVPPPPPPSTAPPAPPIAPVKKGRTKKKLAYDNEVLMQGVQLCEDGKYRWIYALNMWTNPSILILIFKIFFWIFGYNMFKSMQDCL